MNETEAIKQYGLDKHPNWVVLMYFEGNDLFNTEEYLERQATGMSWKEYDFSHSTLWDQLIMPHMIQYWWSKVFPHTAATPAHYRYPVTASTEAGLIPMVLKDFHLLPMSADYRTMAKSDEFAAIKQSLVDLKQPVDLVGKGAPVGTKAHFLSCNSPPSTVPQFRPMQLFRPNQMSAVGALHAFPAQIRTRAVARKPTPGSLPNTNRKSPPPTATP